MEAALHVNKASGHTLADAVRGAPPETHRSEGGGVWAEYLPNAALTSNDLFLDDANALVPVWLGGRGDRPAFAMDATGFFGRYLFTVKIFSPHSWHTRDQRWQDQGWRAAVCSTGAGYELTLQLLALWRAPGRCG